MNSISDICLFVCLFYLLTDLFRPPIYFIYLFIFLAVRNAQQSGDGPWWCITKKYPPPQPQNGVSVD